MCRILYALLTYEDESSPVNVATPMRLRRSGLAPNQPRTDSKIRRFMSHSRSLRNGRPALDGYGLAGFNPTTGKWKIYRSVSEPGRDLNSESVAEKMSAYPLVLGHLRHRIDSESAKPAEENTHPFYYKNRVFLHNGHIDGVYTPANRQWFLANILPEFHGHIRGETDTELLFYLFLTILSRKEDISRDISALKSRGCDRPNRFNTLHESVIELFQLLDKKFQMYIVNFVYAEKEYSIVTHIMKNASETDQRNNPMYLQKHPLNNKMFMFSSEPMSKNYEPVHLNTFYIVNHLTGEYTQFKI